MDDIAFPTAGEGAGAPASKDSAYRVLARKYRPQTFEDLVGQEPMVQTLENAFDTGRIAQAWMLTGVRGVGKTTTARILARGLNYEVPGVADKPTVRLEQEGSHCKAIMEGRHVDVIEMDAASHTGINDIREITDAARYRPATARYKVYIIDEVHMLSNAAFNGLLKTLEEPPEHVKFIFATTEIRKVPVTVLSRCQRFDLRRIDQPKLVGLLRRISDAENIQITDEALTLIARAGEGSARDSLSLLDQAMAHGAGAIEAPDVRSMLGLADRARVIDLFEHVMSGNIAAAMEELAAQYAVGADPAVVLTDLADFTHLVTRLKIVPKAGDDVSVTETERVRGHEFAEKLSMRLLSRAWQILLKGVQEVQSAPKPLAAADMVLVRLAYAADLPDPGDALALLRSGGLVPAGG
ncbi:MAG: DNA polymerase III subunit gamma/tau, partial [Roseibium sp.]